jgi:hypothetical protein
METYSPKRNNYISDADIKATAEQIFNAEATDTYQTTVRVEGDVKDVSGHLLDSSNPFLERIAVGRIDMGTRKDWIHIDISQLEGENVKEKLNSASQREVKEAAVAKNRFIKETTGYSVEDIKEKEKSTAKGYDSLSNL